MIEPVTDDHRLIAAETIGLKPQEVRLIEKLRQLRGRHPQGTILVVEINCGPRQLRWREAGKAEG